MDNEQNGQVRGRLVWCQGAEKNRPFIRSNEMAIYDQKI